MIAFGTKYQISVSRQGGREMSAPRPCERDPFQPIGSTCNNKQFLYMCKSGSVMSSMWYVRLFWYGVNLTIGHALFMINTQPMVQNDYSVFHTQFKIHGIFDIFTFFLKLKRKGDVLNSFFFFFCSHLSFAKQELHILC